MKSATFSYYSVTYLCLCFFGFIIVSVHEQEFKCGVKPRENQGNSPFTPGAKYKIYNTKSKKTNKIKCIAARNNQNNLRTWFIKGHGSRESGGNRA